MAVCKVIYHGDVIVDLTADTVTSGVLKKGYTAHNSIGEIITGTLDESAEVDDIDIVLAYGFTEGTRTFAEDGTITAKDSAGRTLVRTFTDGFKTCTSVLTDADGTELGKMVKTYADDFTEVTITDRHGNTKVKKIAYSVSQVESTVE